MNIFSFRTLIISLFILITVFSCKKDEEEETTTPNYTLSSNITTNITHDATMDNGKTYTIDGTIYVDGAT